MELGACLPQHRPADGGFATLPDQAPLRRHDIPSRLALAVCIEKGTRGAEDLKLKLEMVVMVKTDRDDRAAFSAQGSRRGGIDINHVAPFPSVRPSSRARLRDAKQHSHFDFRSILSLTTPHHAAHLILILIISASRSLLHPTLHSSARDEEGEA